MTRQRYEGLVREFIRRVAEYNHNDGDGKMRTGLSMQYAMQNTAKRVREQGKSYQQVWDELADVRKVFGM